MNKYALILYLRPSSVLDARDTHVLLGKKEKKRSIWSRWGNKAEKT